MQILDAEEPYAGAAEFSLDGRPITQVTLVGKVRAVNPQLTNVTYRLDDGTGVLEVKRWVDPDRPGDGAFRTAVIGPIREMRKSSTRPPSASTAWARTPAGAGTRSELCSSGRNDRACAR